MDPKRVSFDDDSMPHINEDGDPASGGPVDAVPDAPRAVGAGLKRISSSLERIKQNCGWTLKVGRRSHSP